jgi:RNA polymerase sigma-70 factor (ECF subfamily)
MQDSPITRPSLLVRIRDARDREAWSQFVRVYVPLIYRFVLRSGLQDADAADVTQEVLQAVARACKRLDYDPQRGRFRSWLLTVVRSKLGDFVTDQRKQERGTGDTDMIVRLDNVPAREADDARWEQDYERHVFTWAAQQVRGDFTEPTWQAFWQSAVEGKSGKDVAEGLGMSIGAVYIAKSRVLARLKEQIRQLDGE